MAVFFWLVLHFHTFLQYAFTFQWTDIVKQRTSISSGPNSNDKAQQRSTVNWCNSVWQISGILALIDGCVAGKYR